jgi:hypothetical protein
VGFWLVDHKSVNIGILMIFGLSLLIPLIGLLYLKLERVILRRAGVPPMEEQIASLKLPQQQLEVPVELRKAA